jgi:leucyl-tRNA synthetase
MMCVNDLTSLKCHKKEVLEPLLILLAPFAPHITEELWEQLGHTESIHTATWPDYNEEYLKENAFTYPVSINGKMRTQLTLPVNMSKEDVEKEVLANEVVLKWTEGKAPKKVIVVPNRIVNVVI